MSASRLAKQPEDGAAIEQIHDISRRPQFSGLSGELGVASSLFPIQAKLTIGQPNDKYEQEADRVASQVVKQINAPASVQSSQGQSVQRTEAPEKELIQTITENTSLRRNEAIAGGEASTDLDTAINSARGSGQPLDAGLQRSMGKAMGADFSRVKVYTDAQSDQLNQSIQAKAFTTGQDVFFRHGEYNPGSRGGQALIAHELTHVVQQKGGAVQRLPLPQQLLPQHPTTEKQSQNVGEGANHGEGEKTWNKQESSERDERRNINIKESTPTTVQRQIYYDQTKVLFEIDNIRPGWVGAIAGPLGGINMSRNHIIAFETIQNDLCNILNALVTVNNAANQNRLDALTEAVMPTAGVEKTVMITWRNKLKGSIGAGTVTDYEKQARHLLSRLNSSLDNVRPGDSAINTSIGQNIDADFTGGTTAFAGGMVRTAAAPAGVYVPAQTVLTLTVASNAIAYRYQQGTEQEITFVINPANNRQLSSVTGPTVGTVGPAPPHPVLVTDPANMALPFLYT